MVKNRNSEIARLVMKGSYWAHKIDHVRREPVPWRGRLSKEEIQEHIRGVAQGPDLVKQAKKLKEYYKMLEQLWLSQRKLNDLLSHCSE